MTGTSGPILPVPFAFYDPGSQSLRTSATTFGSDSTPYSQTLPVSGSMRNGSLYARATFSAVTSASGCSSLPLLKTPTANLGSNGGSQHPDRRIAGGHGPTLADEVEWLLPTPTTSQHDDGKDPAVWRARRERLRDKHGQGVGTPPLSVLARTLGDGSPPPSRGGRKRSASSHPGQLTIEAG